MPNEVANKQDCGNLSKALSLLNRGLQIARENNYDKEKTLKEIAKEVGIPFDVPIALPYNFWVVLGMKFQPEALAGKDVTMQGERKKITKEQYNKELSALHYFMNHGGCLVGHFYWGADRTIIIGNILIVGGVNGTAAFVQMTEGANALEKRLAKSMRINQSMGGNIPFLRGVVAAICGPAKGSTQWYSWSELYEVMQKIKKEVKIYDNYIRGNENSLKARASYGLGTAVGDTVQMATLGAVDSDNVRNTVVSKTMTNTNKKVRKKYV